MLDLCIDTNIILALWNGEKSAGDVAKILNGQQKHSRFIISSMVWIELHAHPTLSSTALESELEKMRITHDVGFTADMIADAASAFGTYAQRRRVSAGGDVKRLPADLLIGSHAMHKNRRLLTLDSGRYKVDFPLLDILSPL